MTNYEQIEVIPFTPPYDREEGIQRIQANIGRMANNSLPIFQVEVGADIHLKSTAAVIDVVEQAYNQIVQDDYRANGFPPFALSSQNMRAPYYMFPTHVTPDRLAPHLDSQQVGPAIHKEYPGTPTPVQGGYPIDGAKLPHIDFDLAYEGPGVEAYAHTVHQGIAQLGRLTIFSQGDPLIDMKQTLHYFDRDTLQPFGGRYTRYYMPDPAMFDFGRLQSYDKYVQMRRRTSLHLDYEQWRFLSYELTQLPDNEHAELRALVAQQLADHPGKEYTFWHRVGDDTAMYSYGVTSVEHPIDAKENYQIYQRQ